MCARRNRSRPLPKHFSRRSSVGLRKCGSAPAAGRWVQTHGDGRHERGPDGARAEAHAVWYLTWMTRRAIPGVWSRGRATWWNSVSIALSPASELAASCSSFSAKRACRPCRAGYGSGATAGRFCRPHTDVVSRKRTVWRPGGATVEQAAVRLVKSREYGHEPAEQCRQQARSGARAGSGRDVG